jgi:uncharacterized membrane protein
VTYAIQLFKQPWLFQGVFRWLHIIVGITWIGLLYYFNLVQVPAFARLSAGARNEALHEVTRRALWWFRWAALATVVFGLMITGQKDYWANSFFKRPTGLSIFIGMILGIIMFLNVWGVIWRKQKLVLQNAYHALNNLDPVPGVAEAGRRALIASRQNFIFSIPMLWFMVGTSHFYVSNGFASPVSSGRTATFLIISLVIILVLELNSLGVFGVKPGQVNLWIYENHRNAIIAGFVLWAILWIVSELLFKV